MKTFVQFCESNADFKKIVLKAYHECGKDEKKFIHLLKGYTGLTDQGVKKHPMVQTALQTLMFESTGKPISIVQGRFQPPTLGHLKAIEHAYKKFHAPVAVVMIKGAKSDVMFDAPVQEKIFHGMLKGIPHVILHAKSGFIGDIVDGIRAKGYEPKAIFTGTDRVKTYEAQINRYKDDMNLNMTVEEIPRGEEDISATKVRNALKSDDIAAFKKLMHPSTHSMFSDLKKLV